MAHEQDPGWTRAVKASLVSVIPFVGLRMALKTTNGLITLRHIWLTFVNAMILVWAVVIFLDTQLSDGGVDSRFAAGVVVGLGVVAQLAGAALLPEIDGKTDQDVRVSAQRRFFIRIAIAEVPALLGFAGFILSMNPWVYGAGFAVAMAGFLDARPSAAWIDRGQQQLIAQGSDVRLLSALVGGGITR